MKTINKQRLRIMLVAAACGGVAGPVLMAQDESAPSGEGPDIVARSPFIPPGFSPPQAGKNAAATAAAGGYEFRGVYQLGDEYRFLVSQPRSRNGNWVQVGKSYEDYEVRRYDAASETLTLFFNNSETKLTLAEMESNPTPTPVSGQIQTAAAPPGSAPNAAPQPVRRTIRPATRTGESSSSPPPPAWLEKLREEAAARRAQAAQSRFGAAGNPGSGVNASGTPGAPGSPGDSPIPAPPDMPPPTPPPNLSEIDIPPPPTTLPPPPPPEVMKQIQQSMSYSPVPPNG